MYQHPSSLRTIVVLAACGLLSACASAPPLDAAGTRVGIKPYQVQNETDLDESVVLWGGLIVEINNREDSTEIIILAYPLDEGQRPKIDAPSAGRFVAILPGFVEPLTYPEGRFVTLRGRLLGTREGMVAQAQYRYPLVAVQAAHLWPGNFRNDGPKFSIGVGVGITR